MRNGNRNPIRQSSECVKIDANVGGEGPDIQASPDPKAWNPAGRLLPRAKGTLPEPSPIRQPLPEKPEKLLPSMCSQLVPSCVVIGKVICYLYQQPSILTILDSISLTSIVHDHVKKVILLIKFHTR